MKYNCSFGMTVYEISLKERYRKRSKKAAVYIDKNY